MNILTNQIPPQLPNNTYVAMDTEWYGMVKSRMHRPHTGKFACLTICHQIGEVYLINDRCMVPEVLEKLDNCVWIFHNAKFDLTHLRRLATIPPRGKVIDTMMMERILWNGLFEAQGFGLDDLARRYLKIHLDKSLQEKWQTMTEMSPETIQYSVTDAEVLLRIWNKQKTHITKRDMQVYRDIDLPAMWAVMDFQGFALDVKGWELLAEDNRAEAKRLEEQLDFNPRSTKQAVAKLRERGFKGLPNNQAETIRTFIEKYPDSEAAKQATIALAAKEMSSFASKYGKSWLEDYLECFPDGSYGFVPNFNIIGAETGRMSADHPPLHQIPSRTTKVFRKKFIARPGNKLVICDYSQQEIAVMGFVTGDKVMIEICNSGQDAYIMMAKTMYGKDITKKDPLRSRMKSVVLGIDYGMSKYGLAKKEGITEKEAAEVIYLFRSKFTQVSDYLDQMEREHTVVYTVAGRKFWLNPYNSQSYRNALNAPIQGTAADMMKAAVGALHREWPVPCDFGIVNVIHDEVVLDVPEQYAEEVRKFTSYIMVREANKMCPGMSFRADATIGNTWADKE